MSAVFEIECGLHGESLWSWERKHCCSVSEESNTGSKGHVNRYTFLRVEDQETAYNALIFNPNTIHREIELENHGVYKIHSRIFTAL